jgi:hypothetical protein
MLKIKNDKHKRKKKVMNRLQNLVQWNLCDLLNPSDVHACYQTSHTFSQVLRKHMIGLREWVFPMETVCLNVKDRACVRKIVFVSPSSFLEIPRGVKQIRFDEKFNQVLSIVGFPPNVTHLIFGRCFNQPVYIPDHVTHVVFGENFNQPVYPGNLPIGLTHLTFGREFNHAIEPHTFPLTVSHITFGLLFNKPLVVDNFPPSVTHLTFGDHFDHPVVFGSLPPNLKHLNFGKWFNQTLQKVHLPPSITHLVFGDFFSRPIVSGFLPYSLTHLTFGECYDQPINPDVLPQGLTHLAVGTYFNQPQTLRMLHLLQLVITHKKKCLGWMKAPIKHNPFNKRQRTRV